MSQDEQTIKVEELAQYTSAEMREQCFKIRDECFNCLDTKRKRNLCRDPCTQFFSGKYCLQSWIRHFSKKRRYAKAWEFYTTQSRKVEMNSDDNN